jgi:hypothetical protein
METINPELFGWYTLIATTTLKKKTKETAHTDPNNSSSIEIYIFLLIIDDNLISIRVKYIFDICGFKSLFFCLIYFNSYHK